MELDRLLSSERAALDEMLGYLNFSSGAPDPRFQQHCDSLYSRLDANLGPQGQPWTAIHQLLNARLHQLVAEATQGGTFSDASQAEAVIAVVFEHLLDSYRRFHRDLLYHQSDRNLFSPFFIARAFETVLAIGVSSGDTKEIVDDAVGRLNDFIGYRPVAVLRTRQRLEPYAHEWVCPLPLYFRGAGVAHGPYHDLIVAALNILRATDEDVLRQASFDPERLDELALDPRAYDFDHPANKRPNFHFGLWDPHRIDQHGHYRRFVLQGVTLDAILQRTLEPASIRQEERLVEAAAILAGTMLMASAVSGEGPEAHDSNTTLATLVPRIAQLRDTFYERLLARLDGPHGDRLHDEAKRLRQPFGGARQQLNQRLARLRATQLEHVHLAQLFARMGYPEASARQSHVVPVTSARILCDISSRLTTSQQLIRRGQLDEVVRLVDEIDDLLHRGIECGALVDPWNILGFQGQFSLFPAIENSVRDHRVDVLMHVMRQTFDLLVRLNGETAASGQSEACAAAAKQIERIAAWWDQFASIEVAGIEKVFGQEAVDSARQLAAASAAWRAAGESAGDLSFWRGHVEGFDSPKPYALVIESLLDRRDFAASRALLIHWVSQCDRVPLAEGRHSFHELSLRWMRLAVENAGENWSVIAKLFDHLEANAESLWDVPQLDVERPSKRTATSDESKDDAIDDGDEDRENADDVYGAAYDDVVYRDTTADGTEGSTLEGGAAKSEFVLEVEGDRLSERLAFLVTVARLWRIAAQGPATSAGCEVHHESREESLQAWHDRARHNALALETLLDDVMSQTLPEPIGTQESMVEYDRCRLVKESVLGNIIYSCGETAIARRALMVAIDPASETRVGGDGTESCERMTADLCRALARGDSTLGRELFEHVRERLDNLPVLYVPLARRGNPRQIVAAQNAQQLLVDLGRMLPRAGLLAEACEIVGTAQSMERHRPAGDGVVTEFDRIFERTFTAIVESLIDAVPDAVESEDELAEVIEHLTDALSERWKIHSRSLRLSVLERVTSREKWREIVEFIERFGRDIFTPRFVNLGNLRAVLHQSVEAYLARLERDEDDTWKLIDELDKSISRAKAVELLTLILEALVENYGEYKDYNSTTTQSDRGDLLYVLLDFLRLKASYDVYTWSIRPLLLAHEILVRRGKTQAAEQWRHAIVTRTSEAADWHLRRLDELVAQYGVRLPSISDRLHERFVRTLACDRMRALVEPAIHQARACATPEAFDLLEQEISGFTEQPTGSGLEVPDWLAALETEADRVLTRHCTMSTHELCSPAKATALDWENLVAQVRSIEQSG